MKKEDLKVKDFYLYNPPVGQKYYFVQYMGRDSYDRNYNFFNIWTNHFFIMAEHDLCFLEILG